MMISLAACALPHHSIMLVNKRTTATRRKQEEENREQGLETGWQPRPSWCQQKDNRRTRRGQGEDKQKYNKRTMTGDRLAAGPLSRRTARGQQEDKKRTRGGRQEENMRRKRVKKSGPPTAFTLILFKHNNRYSK